MSRLLIVEDEPNSAQALELFFSESGYQVSTAARASEAISSARELAPDVLLTDVLLVGERDGLAVARELRSCDPSLPVIVMSGLPEHEVLGRAGGVELFAICPKPLRLRDLATTIESALASRASAEAGL